MRDDLAVAANGTFTFATSLTSGSTYAVTVASPAFAGQTCTVTNGSRHRGGRQRHQRLRELRREQVHHRWDGDRPHRHRPRAAEQRWRRPRRRRRTAPSPSPRRSPAAAPTRSRSPTQPTGARPAPSRMGSGTVGRRQRHQRLGQLRRPSTYTVGGTVTGLPATGLVLRNNGGDDLAVALERDLHLRHAAHQRQHLRGDGRDPAHRDRPAPSRMARAPSAGANVTNVSVSCPRTRYTIGGTVSGLTGTGLVLQNGTSSAVTANGAFVFTTSVTSGGTYAVTVDRPAHRPGPDLHRGRGRRLHRGRNDWRRGRHLHHGDLRPLRSGQSPCRALP